MFKKINKVMIDKELQKKIFGMKVNLVKKRLQIQKKEVKDTSSLKKIRKDIARELTKVNLGKNSIGV